MKEVAEQSKRNADANLAMASTQNKRLALEADTIIGENAKELVTILAQEIESIQNFLVSPGRAFFPNEQAEKIEELAELKQQLKTAKLQRFEIMSNTAHRVRTVMAGAPGAAAALSEPAGSVRAAPAVAAAPSSPAGSAPAALPAAPGSWTPVLSATPTPPFRIYKVLWFFLVLYGLAYYTSDYIHSFYKAARAK
jgi:hypothetical protein